jgi:general stress protein CsbA
VSTAARRTRREPPPARRIGYVAARLIPRIARELLIPTWGKIPEKMVLASVAVTLAANAVREYTETVGKRIDVEKVKRITKYVAEINGVRSIDYNHDDVMDFLLENAKIRDNDTYFTYLKRVGVVCTVVLLTVLTTSGYLANLDLREYSNLEEGERSSGDWL